MSPRAIERVAYVGAVAFAVILVAVLLVSPLEAIWTGAIVFGIALLALVTETLALRGHRHVRR